MYATIPAAAPKRKSWPRRHKIMTALVIAIAVLAAGGIALKVQRALTPKDYRDPVQLAQAMKDAHHGTGASCAKMPTGTYLCVVANGDGAAGTYTVTVSADGSGYQAS